MPRAAAATAGKRHSHNVLAVVWHVQLLCRRLQEGDAGGVSRRAQLRVGGTHALPVLHEKGARREGNTCKVSSAHRKVAPAVPEATEELAERSCAGPACAIS